MKHLKLTLSLLCMTCVALFFGCSEDASTVTVDISGYEIDVACTGEEDAPLLMATNQLRGTTDIVYNISFYGSQTVTMSDISQLSQYMGDNMEASVKNVLAAFSSSDLVSIKNVTVSYAIPNADPKVLVLNEAECTTILVNPYSSSKLTSYAQTMLTNLFIYQSLDVSVNGEATASLPGPNFTFKISMDLAALVNLAK